MTATADRTKVPKGTIAGCAFAVALAGLIGMPACAAYRAVNFGVSATVSSTCQVSANPYISARLADSAAAFVRIQCSTETSYQITTEPASLASSHLTKGAEAASARGVDSPPTHGPSQTAAAMDSSGSDLIVTVQY